VDYEQLESLRRHNSAWKLLRADNAPLILSFLNKVFVDDNVRSIAAVDLIGRLDDELFSLRERLGDDAFPKSAKAYLDDWAAPERGWLRKYYPKESDEPHFDATPAVEKALGWVRALGERAFVGTESRLNTVFDLLRQMVYGAETDPAVRLAELERRRDDLDAEIVRVRAGDVDVLHDTGLRDRYQQFTATAWELLADFREVETNFRTLDRELRERISAWHGSKGALLDDVLGNHDSIAGSDQGKTFQAFYDFLLSPNRQEELVELLERVQALDSLDADPRVRHIHHDWLEAAERTQATVRQLSEQLRRFLDDQVWFENRRVIDLLRNIESTALRLRDQRDVPVVMEMNAAAPKVVLPMERPLYAPPEKARIDSTSVEPGSEETDTAPLFEQVYVDPVPLAQTVRRALQSRSQIGLVTLLDERPLRQGLAELVTYMSLGEEDFRTVFDEDHREQVRWRDEDGTERRATLPRVTFARAAGSVG
jgi:hypothetical protein